MNFNFFMYNLSNLIFRKRYANSTLFFNLIDNQYVVFTGGWVKDTIRERSRLYLFYLFFNLDHAVYFVRHNKLDEEITVLRKCFWKF